MRTFITIAQRVKQPHKNKFSNFCAVRSSVCSYMWDGSLPKADAQVLFNSISFKSLQGY